MYERRAAELEASGLPEEINQAQELRQRAADHRARVVDPTAAEAMVGDVRTQTPEFQNWFGDSKVVDEQGAPLVVYHGTKSPALTEFSRSANRTAADFYFTPNKETAAVYGQPIPVYLKAEKLSDLRPEHLTNESYKALKEVYDAIGQDYGYEEFNDFADVVTGGQMYQQHNGPGFQNAVLAELNALGYDGVRMTDMGFNGAPDESVVVFDPTQIKSVNNRGTFDPNDPNIEAMAAKQAAPEEIPAGDPVPGEAVSTASLDSANALSQSKAWSTGRELKMALQDAILKAVNGANLLARTTANRAYLVKVGVKDALAALAQNGNAIGWYDLKTRQALGVMSLVHPELATDETSRFAFTWALAVTSNGIKVGKNFELAEMVYSRWKTSDKDPAKRRMPTDIKAGKP